MYEFQLLGLLLMFLLIVVYYAKDDNIKRGNKVFRSIILITYIVELVSTAMYMVLESGSNISIFSRIYLGMTNLWFGLLALYYTTYLFKDKNMNSGKLRIKDLGICFGIIQVISAIGILVAPLSLTSANMINYDKHFVIYLICFYLSIEFLVLLMGIKSLEKSNYLHLVVMFVSQVLMFFFQLRSPEMLIFSIGMILTTYYGYFMLENTGVQELKNITLERDYAKKQCIDKSDFLRILSREIRIPLNTIDGFSQVIMDSDNIDDIKDNIKDIRSASRDLIDVINGMIDLSIIESGNLEVIEENYNVYDMFDDVKNIAESKLRDKNVEFRVELDNDIPEILLGDSARVSQIILNLLTNAIKYTDKGNITLKVDSVKSSTKCRLKIMVSDTGIGIKKEDINNIFDKTSKPKGSSLGLAISKYLLELMGGSIEVESTYGTGSKFIVTLDQKIVSDCREEKVTRKRTLKPFSAGDKRILLVDDNKLNLKVAYKLLEPYKVEVVEALSGKECLEILDKDNKFDLILMDDMMPEMSGTECLSILKKIERVDGFYIPVVALTANAISGMKEKYLSLGFEDYLAKPIDKYELDRILKKYLKDKR